MKQLINPPVQSFLWLGGFVCLGLAGWSLFELKMMDESQAARAGNVSVSIPDASVLDIPAPGRYAQMVNTPLFWEERKAVEPPRVAPPQPVAAAPVDMTLPEGRLIGIIDLGESLFAIMQNAAGGSVHLRQGDSWGAWKVTGIESGRLILGLAGQEQAIPLIGDFSAPQENPQVAQARQQQLAAQRQRQAQEAARPPVTQQVNAPTPFESVPNSAGMPLPAEAAQQPPALSAQDALEARQRLMASRWGAMAGSEQEPPGQPPPR